MERDAEAQVPEVGDLGAGLRLPGGAGQDQRGEEKWNDRR